MKLWKLKRFTYICVENSLQQRFNIQFLYYKNLKFDCSFSFWGVAFLLYKKYKLNEKLMKLYITFVRLVITCKIIIII